MESYMNTLPKALSKEHIETIRSLFDWLIQPCLGNNKPHAFGLVYVCLSVCLSVLSLCLSVSLSLCLSVSLSVCVPFFIIAFSDYLFIYLPVYPPFSLENPSLNI
jgi:maltodextrin utilization protein YvdJ